MKTFIIYGVYNVYNLSYPSTMPIIGSETKYLHIPLQGPEICKTEYESECWTKQEVHDVEDDVVECKTILEEKCQEETSGKTITNKAFAR